MYRIGSGAGFSGDRADAAIAVVAAIAAAGEGGAIMFETLGERTLALGQIAQRPRQEEAERQETPAVLLARTTRSCRSPGG